MPSERQDVRVARSVLQDRARAFSVRFADAASESGERQTFWNEFFALFDLDRVQVAVFEQLARRSSTGGRGFIDLLYPGQMAVEHKSAGEDLDEAMEQVLDYLTELPPAEVPWLLVACDFQRFDWKNLESGTSGSFALSELADNLDVFSWLAGYPAPHQTYEDEETANLAATALMADIHDLMTALGYPGHALREWLTRILFCLFADDTGVWDRAAFHAYLAAHTVEDGSDLGRTVAEVFQVLDTPRSERYGNLRDDLDHFTFINGDLFAEALPIAPGSPAIREALLKACTFDWSRISPAIFGSMFQNVMTPRERRQLGAHYTSEENIIKTIRPLFLDELEAELVAADTRPKLQAFHDKLAELTFFDPACGCGNFLVLAYRELRRLETETLRRLQTAGRTGQREVAGQRAASLELLCRVTVDQFYGIEIDEFATKIARTALYLADHISNREVSAEFGEHFVRFPIPAAPHIRLGDALEVDWADVLSADACSYCFGNPPFAGHTTRSAEQSAQMQRIWGDDYAKWLDFVTTWYHVGMDWAGDQPVRFAFVSTNSVAQGEQVARLWKLFQDSGYRIDFAHQTFAWTSEAQGAAHVHVVIIGFSHESADPPAQRLIFEYETLRSVPVEVAVAEISPYLRRGAPPDIAVEGRSTPISDAMPEAAYGSLPSDGGNLVIKTEEELPTDDEIAMRYVRSYLGSRELVRGVDRWVIWMPDGPEPGDVAHSLFLKRRLTAVSEWRERSRNADTRALAATPYLFFHDAQPSTGYIGIPATVSSNRRWFTVAYLTADTVASNALYTVPDPDGFLFGLMSSSMFVTWFKCVGGMLKSDLRFSQLVYNSFPVPPAMTPEQKACVVEAGKNLLMARNSFPNASLADLYDPLATPVPIIAAHAELDRCVDRLYGSRRDWNEEARLNALFTVYARLAATS